MNKVLASVLLFLFFVGERGLVKAQTDEQTSDRPKIGLVLSGGGAKGVAHVGIIRNLEKAGVRPDYVVGTSMGAVVGGLYALGYSADELEEIILGIDWDLVISNRVSFEAIAFEEKEYYNRYLVELPVENSKIKFNSGLIEGQSLSDVLQYFTWPASNYESFDDFPIAFRCVATDVSNGQPVIWSDGYLHDALRSSIAIPTIFSAFEQDSTVLVDGGVVDNYPVDVARDMGAEIVIGVNLGDEDFINANELGGFGGILMQLAMASSLSKTKASIEDTDIYIKPELADYSTGSFSAYKEILALGEIAGQKAYPEFKALADSLGIDDPPYSLGFDALPLKISGIEVTGNKIFTSDLILSKLDLDVGEVVTRNELKLAVQQIFGINGFSKVDYSLRKNPSGDFNLNLRVKEKSANLLNVAFHYDNQFSAGILLNYTLRDWLGSSSRTVIVGNISENPKLRFDYYKYTGESKNFAFNFRANALRQQLPRYEKGDQTDVLIDRNTRFEAQMISTSSLKQSFLFGAVFESSKSRFRFNSEFPDDIKNGVQNFTALRLRYYRNSQNDRNYPTRGAESLIETNFHLNNFLKLNLANGVDTVFIGDLGEAGIGIPADLLGEVIKELTPGTYLTLLAKYSKFFPISSKVQFRPEIAGALTISNESEGKIFNDFFVGGYQNVRFTDTRFWGLNYAEVTSPNFLKASMDIQVIPIKKIYLRAGINWLGFGQVQPIGDMDNLTNIFSRDTYLGYGADVSYQSLLGPISMGISSNSKDREIRTYLSIGFSFNYSDR